MTEEEKKKMADLEAKVTELTEANTKLVEENNAKAKEVAEKDAIIDQKNADIVGARKEGQALKALTAKQKEEMTAAEIRLHEATLELQEKQSAFEKQQQESAQKEIAARRQRALDKLAGNDKDLRKKIEDNYARIKDAETAQTDEEIAKVATEAFNMTGSPRPSPLGTVVNTGSGEAGADNGGQSFAETPQGTQLAGKLGLPTPPAAK